MGKLRIPLSEVNGMSWRDIFNAIAGYSEAKREDYALLFDLVKLHGLHVTPSKEQSKSLNKQRNPFREISSGRPMTMEKILGMFPKKESNGT